MAITSTISLTQSTGIIGNQIDAILAISNSDTISAVNILTVTPIAYATGSPTKTPGTTAVSLGSAPLNPNSIITIGPSSSVKVAFQATFTAPSISGSSYSIGAYVTTSDGSITSPTPATVTISGLSSSTDV